jgi:hypothetical protein
MCRWRDNVTARKLQHDMLAQAELASQVLPLLGWDGNLVVDARAWSTRRLVVCALDQTEHARRTANGLLPITDPFLLRCVGASNPGFMTARPPVRIAGAIAVRNRWSTAVANLGGFTAFGAVAAVLPARQADRLDVAADAAVAGFGVIAQHEDGRQRLVHYPDLRPRVRTRTWVHRLVEEIVYDALLAATGDEQNVTFHAASPSSASNQGSSSRHAGPF